MEIQFNEIEKQALLLPPEVREMLATRLLQSLDNDTDHITGKTAPGKDEVSADGKEETGQMTLERMMDKTISVLQYFTGNADAIMTRSEPGQDSGLLEVMNRLAERLNSAEDESDLVTIANIVYDLTIGIPYFPPDESPPRHFRLEGQKQMRDNDSCRSLMEKHKAALQKVFAPCFKRIEQAWRDMPSPIPPNASPGSEEPPWELMGIFQDDPTWLEIEQERDKTLLESGGETE